MFVMLERHQPVVVVVGNTAGNTAVVVDSIMPMLHCSLADLHSVALPELV